MLKTDFKKWFKDLHSRYPGFQMPEPAAVTEIYFQELGAYSDSILRRAVSVAIKASPNFFPSLAVIKNACESMRDESEAQIQYPKPRYWPDDHGCGLNGKQVPVEHARSLLFHIAPYEAIHVLCKGTFEPLCPWCGSRSKPWINPFIKKLMEDYPQETKHWNPLHKGHLLCDPCSRIEYPGNFTRAIDRGFQYQP